MFTAIILHPIKLFMWNVIVHVSYPAQRRLGVQSVQRCCAAWGSVRLWEWENVRGTHVSTWTVCMWPESKSFIMVAVAWCQFSVFCYLIPFAAFIIFFFPVWFTFLFFRNVRGWLFWSSVTSWVLPSMSPSVHLWVMALFWQSSDSKSQFPHHYLICLSLYCAYSKVASQRAFLMFLLTSTHIFIFGSERLITSKLYLRE